MKTARLFTATCAAALLAACSSEPVAEYAGAPTTQAERQSSLMAGELPTIQPFSAQVDHAYSDIGYGYSYVEFHVSGDFGWAMVGISTWGDALGEGDFAPGTSHTFSLSDGYGSDTGVDVIGCSGPSTGDFEFDELAEEFTLTVDTVDVGGQDVISVIVGADFGDAGSVSVESPVPESTW